MSVRIDPAQLADAVARRPYAYVVTASGNARPHLRAVVATQVGEWFVIRVGPRTADNVGQSGEVTLLWPPLPTSECRDAFDDHSVIADCEAVSEATEDSNQVRARAITAVWHRPAR